MSKYLKIYYDIQWWRLAMRCRTWFISLISKNFNDLNIGNLKANKCGIFWVLSEFNNLQEGTQLLGLDYFLENLSDQMGH